MCPSTASPEALATTCGSLRLPCIRRVACIILMHAYLLTITSLPQVLPAFSVLPVPVTSCAAHPSTRRWRSVAPSSSYRYACRDGVRLSCGRLCIDECFGLVSSRKWQCRLHAGSRCVRLRWRTCMVFEIWTAYCRRTGGFSLEKRARCVDVVLHRWIR